MTDELSPASATGSVGTAALEPAPHSPSPAAPRSGQQCAADAALLARLRDGDEAAFAELVAAWSPAMLRMARAFVHTRQAAEDVVQDTWLGVIAGLSRFEGRSTLRTWTFSILINRARTTGARDARTVLFSQLGDEDRLPTVDPDRFQGQDGEDPAHWTSMGAPARWAGDPERRALDREIRDAIDQALDRLPVRQRVTVTLRDVLGLDAEEACGLLGVTPQNQRVLLHRGRAALRTELDAYYIS